MRTSLIFCFSCVLLHISAADHGQPRTGSASAIDVGAFYFGDWHPNSIMESYHGQGWTEMNIVVNATPRFEGHIQPNVPTWSWTNPKQREDTPEGAELRIQAASGAGLDFFMFDWYWYEGKPFLDGALNNGFLRANSTRAAAAGARTASGSPLQFALMWANQDWVDVHPAKAGWHATGRPSPGGPRELLMLDGNQSAAQYTAAFDHICESFMTHPLYYRLDTPREGPSVKCPLLALYLPQNMLEGAGGMDAAADVVKQWRAKAKATPGVGCLHFQLMGGGIHDWTPAMVQQLGADSVTHYGWMKTTKANFPSESYTDIAAKATAAWPGFETRWGVPYVPSASVAWDPSPRCIASDTYVDRGYPWTGTFRSTPAEFQSALETAIKYLQGRCEGTGVTSASGRTRDRSNGTAGGAGSGSEASDICPPLMINAWNEWSEGAYLEPDEREGTARLDAIRAVFGV